MNVTGTPAACHAPPTKQPIEPAPRTATLAAATICLDALVRQPQPVGRRPRLPEDVDRHPAARIPIAADAQPLRLHLLRQPLPDADGHVFVEAVVVAVTAEEQLEALALDDCFRGGKVDHQ